MTLTALRAFVEVCRLGSITAAAGALGYTQSGLSRQVAALEAETGTTLLVRGPRGVAPTPDGTAVLDHARAILREADRMAEQLRGDTAARAHLGVGAVPSAAATVVASVVARMRVRFPHARLTLVEGFSPDLLSRTAAGELDASVVTDYAPGLGAVPALTYHHLVEDEVWIALPAGHPAAGRRGRLPLDLFRDAEWVEDYRGSAHALVAACARSGFAPRIEHGCSGLTGKLALVAAGVGVAIVPGLLVPSVRGDVACRQLADPPTRGVYLAVHARSQEHPLVVALLDEVRQAVAAAPVGASADVGG